MQFSKFPLFVYALLAVGIVQAAPKSGDDQIELGKWVGYIQPEDSPDAIALTLDSYLVKPEDIKLYPHLEMLAKLSLGGYLSPEYESETFVSPHYDFFSRTLTLDDPRVDFSLTAKVEGGQLEGTAYFRTSAIRAKVSLRYQAAQETPPPTPPLVPTLAGQYEGKCGQEDAILQLETGKGLTLETPTPSTGLHHYWITGGLAVVNGVCPKVFGLPGRPSYCVDHAFASGTYDFVGGRLFLSGMQETESCERQGMELVCKMRMVPRSPVRTDLVEETCHFKKMETRVTPFRSFAREYHVIPELPQTRPLPASAPPANASLLQTVAGSFRGYLHHEALDRYQPLQLDVTATTSTDNPHKDNNVYVAVNSILYFDNGTPRFDFWAQSFERRVLYLVPGYSLTSEQSDAFLQITQWKAGYLQGVWYSHAFGRVGTFEAVKSSEFPPLDPKAQRLPSVGGRYRGPRLTLRAGVEDGAELSFQVPRQPRSGTQSYLVFQGNSRLWVDGFGLPASRFERGAYDFYANSMAWLFLPGPTSSSEPAVVTGEVLSPTELSLFWPGERFWAVGMYDRSLRIYRAVGRN